MNQIPGRPINPRLAKLALGVISFIALGIFIWPHLRRAKASIPEVPITHLSIPQAAQAIVKTTFKPPVEPMASPTPKAQPTPCEPCIQAANEVLNRYLHAIRTGAGDDNPNRRNTIEVPQVYSQQASPVWKPAIPSVR